ncbi:hypothetical protein QO003_000220 [Arthrobacter silviterrae]|nr:hypothetical protein [Arthrobacter silviterrae]
MKPWPHQPKFVGSDLRPTGLKSACFRGRAAHVGGLPGLRAYPESKTLTEIRMVWRTQDPVTRWWTGWSASLPHSRRGLAASSCRSWPAGRGCHSPLRIAWSSNSPGTVWWRHCAPARRAPLSGFLPARTGIPCRVLHGMAGRAIRALNQGSRITFWRPGHAGGPNDCRGQRTGQLRSHISRGHMRKPLPRVSPDWSDPRQIEWLTAPLRASLPNTIPVRGSVIAPLMELDGRPGNWMWDALPHLAASDRWF